MKDEGIKDEDIQGEGINVRVIDKFILSSVYLCR